MYRLSFFALSLLMLAVPALADMYKCPDGRGKVQYQNVPCADGAAPVFETTPRDAYAPRDRPYRESESSPAVPALLTLPEPVASEPARRATATPLDTKAFGLLALGMSDATVRARVGEPDAVTDRGYQTVGGIGRGRIALKEIHSVTWTYFGDSQTLDSHLHFADGTLVRKEKTGR